MHGWHVNPTPSYIRDLCIGRFWYLRWDPGTNPLWTFRQSCTGMQDVSFHLEEAFWAFNRSQVTAKHSLPSDADGRLAILGDVQSSKVKKEICDLAHDQVPVAFCLSIFTSVGQWVPIYSTHPKHSCGSSQWNLCPLSFTLFLEKIERYQKKGSLKMKPTFQEGLVLETISMKNRPHWY